MIKFFRHIRQRLLSEGKTGKYLKYAIGEIVLVVIGILIALSINNWNELNKTKSIEKKSYENLLSSLRKDSLQLIIITDYQTKNLNMQNRFIKTNASEIVKAYSSDSISKMLFDIYRGAYSFFPNHGTYNSIASNKGIDIISSEIIKSNLIDLYDYEYSRYEFIDKVLDDKYMNVFLPFLHKEIGFFVDSNFRYNSVSVTQFENNYSALQLECQNLNPMSTNVSSLLNSIQNNVNFLIKEIEKELNK
ncbi:MAG: hypothetical protein KC469_08360 [Flavobacteriaceae bacterium]|nr:hypothetical protein [Flavobacteriaceae bacterium]